MGQILRKCLIIQAILVIVVTSTRGTIAGEHQDAPYFPDSYHSSDRNGGEKGAIFLAENRTGVFVWNGLYCYRVPDATCDNRDCEAIRLCCNDLNHDGLFERCSRWMGNSCPEGAEPITAYCKK